MATNDLSIHDCLIRLGVFKALYQSAVQFNNIAFRVVVGVLAGVPPDSVALVSGIEFTLNWILEVPGGFVADRFGRVPSALFGISMVIFGLFLVYLSLFQFSNDPIGRWLFITHGVLLGFAKPLLSGSIEAFYQDVIKRQSTEETEHLVKTSFTASQSYGRYFTSGAVVLAFITIYIFHKTIGAEHVLLIGLALWGLTFYRLLSDYRTLGNGIAHEKSTSPMALIKKVVSDPQIGMAAFYQFSFHMMLVVVAGFLLISFGRDYRDFSENLQWATMVSFFLGLMAVGWVFKSMILPKARSIMSRDRYISSSIFMAILANIPMLYLGELSSPTWIVAMVFFYGIIIHVSLFAIQGESANMALERAKKSDYA